MNRSMLRGCKTFMQAVVSGSLNYTSKTHPIRLHKGQYDWWRENVKKPFTTALAGFIMVCGSLYAGHRYRVVGFSVVSAYEETSSKAGGRKQLTVDQAIEKSRDLCQRIKDETGSPGLTVAVSVDGNVVWSEGMGFADVENRLPCNPETVFRIASISKPITMAAVAKLWENGDLDLDKPVQFYVPSFPEKTFDGKKVTITTRHLLSHLSGVRHYYKDYSKYKINDKAKNQSEGSRGPKAECLSSQSDVTTSTTGQSEPVSQSKEELKKSEQSEEKSDKTTKSGSKSKKGSQTESSDEMMLAEYYIKKKYSSVTESLEIFKNDPLVYSPGSRFLYTTHGWTLVSAVVEGAGKTSFEKCIRKLFSDLGMDSTYLEENEPLIYNRGRHYVKNKRGRLENAPYVDLSYKWAGGGFISNAFDLVKFGNIMMYSYQMGNPGIHRDQENKTLNPSQYTDSTCGNETKNKQGADHDLLSKNVVNVKTDKTEVRNRNISIKAHGKHEKFVKEAREDNKLGEPENVKSKQVVIQGKSLLPGYLKPETVKMIWEPVRNTKIDQGTGGIYGMGWRIFESKPEHGLCKEQRYYVSHTGGAIGASSVLLIAPSNKEFSGKNMSYQENSGNFSLQKPPPHGVVVAILVNMMSVGLNETAMEIAKTFESISESGL